MKKLIILLGLVAGVAGNQAFAQGQLTFASAGNFGGVVNAPITNSSNVKAAGAAYAADLFFFNGTTTNEASLTSLGLAQTFLSGAQAGYFNGGALTFNGTGLFPTIAAGQTITVEVRAWDTAHGSTFAQAFAAQGAEWIKYNMLSVTLTQPPTTAAGLLGLTGGTMSINPVPEPSTIALGGLGVASLLLFRRKK